MAARANIVLNDAQATPVSHTFAPADILSGQANWEDRSATQYIGFNKLSMRLNRPTGDTTVGNRNLKLFIKLETPKLEVTSNSTVSGIAPAPTVSYRPVIEISVTMPERAQLQDRKDLQKYGLQLFSNSFVTDLFEKFELAY